MQITEKAQTCSGGGLLLGFVRHNAGGGSAGDDLGNDFEFYAHFSLEWVIFNER